MASLNKKNAPNNEIENDETDGFIGDVAEIVIENSGENKKRNRIVITAIAFFLWVMVTVASILIPNSTVEIWSQKLKSEATDVIKTFAVMEAARAVETQDECDVRLKTPFTAMVAGPTGCGKTVLITKLLTHCDTVADRQPLEIIYCYGAWQPAFKALKKNPKITMHEGMIDAGDIPSDGAQRWLVIDDLMSETGGTKNTNDLYTKHSHHKNVSVFFVTQNLFYKGSRTQSINSHYLFLFKNPRDATSIQHLARQMYPGNTKFLTSVFEKATKKPYSHLTIDLKQQTDDSCRLIEGFPGDNMYVYSPLKKNT